MSDRLQDLLRQRTLVSEQLAWLERQIAAEQGIPSLPTPTNRTPAANPAAISPNPSLSKTDGAALEDEAEKILSRYRQDAGSINSRDRRIAWFLCLFGLGLLALGYFLYGLHLGRWW